MAEARVGVRPVPGLGLHYLKVDPAVHHIQAALDSDGMILYIPRPSFLFRSLKKALYRLFTRIYTTIYPLTPLSVAIFGAFFCWLVISVQEGSWLRSGTIATFLWEIDSNILYYTGLELYVERYFRIGYLAFLTAVVACVLFRTAWQCMLLGLLQYRGWLFEARGKVSFMTKFWGMALKALSWPVSKPLLYSFQSCLPRMPVPPLADTVNRILATTKPVLSDQEYKQLEGMAKSFKAEEGPKLNSWLWWKSWWAPNYVTDWWLRFAYLRGRSSLLINSNYYGIGPLVPEFPAPVNYVAHAALIIHKYMKEAQKIATEKLPPMQIQGTVPLCMKQYEYTFASCRIPGRDEDTLKKWDSAFESRHLVVEYRGVYYRVRMYAGAQGKEQLLTPWQLQEELQGILNHKPGPQSEEAAKIAALTTMNRTEWADIREEFFTTGENRQTLEMIERALFLVHLDDKKPDPKDLSLIGNLLFTADGSTMWVDKCFQLTFFANCVWGLHAEHSWGDAPVMSHMVESVNGAELTHYEKGWPYDKDGFLPRLGAQEPASAPRVLRWHVPQELAIHITRAVSEAEAAIANLQLVVREFDDYGKGFVTKVAKCSPDAYVQMALQLAYYRCRNVFPLTYESSMTRLYKHGRTETIRACSELSCKWAKKMCDKKATKEERIEALRAACEHHHELSREAMCGLGCDRHMFALYVVAKGKGINSPFLEKAIKIPWRLSTSQVPQRQAVKGTWPGNDPGDKFWSPSGGFGPVADDGYGVSYAVCGSARFFFHISSKRDCADTDSEVLMNALWDVLAEMKALVT